MVLLKKIIFSFVSALTCISCNHEARDRVKQQEVINKDWKAQFNQTLPLLGHRNWIVIADKAFPLQNAAGIEVINTNVDLLPVLQYVLQEVNSSSHVKPIIYQDKELSFITEDQAKGVKKFANELQQLFNGHQVQTLLHDSVFIKLDEASKLFKILVLKTNETIPYTSVFLQLECAYWGADEERQLRISMNNNK